ncbi:MAG: signal peptidase I, partial [Candidatus Hermodarchaeota archaeon]
SIYKVFDGSTDKVFVVPDYASHKIYADIHSIEIVGPTIYNTLTQEHYTYNPNTGILTLKSDVYQELCSKLDTFSKWTGPENEEGEYLIFKINIEKYHSIEDSNSELTEEKLKQIASMQASQAAILRYYYQFQLATETQEKLNEIAYTVALTVLSTAITSFATGHGVGSVVKNCLKEPLEEILRDPLIEGAASAASGTFAREVLHIEDTRYIEMVASTLSESGREAFQGIFSSAKSSNTHQNNIPSQINTKVDNLKIVNQPETQENDQTIPESTPDTAKTSAMALSNYLKSLLGRINGEQCRHWFKAFKEIFNGKLKDILAKVLGKENDEKVQNKLLSKLQNQMSEENLNSMNEEQKNENYKSKYKISSKIHTFLQSLRTIKSSIRNFVDDLKTLSRITEMVNPQVETHEKTIKEKVKDAVKNTAVKVKKLLHASYQAVRVIGDSMKGIFEHSEIVVAKAKAFFSRYKRGDIVVFKGENGENIIHMIVGKYWKNGKAHYMTWGVNNKYLDRKVITKSDIISKVVISKQDLSKAFKQAKQEGLTLIEALGMKVKSVNIDYRQMLLEQFIRDGLNKEELIEKYGGEKVLENDLEKYFGTKSYEQVIMEIIIEAGLVNEIYIEEIILQIKGRTTLIPHTNNLRNRYRPMINAYCQHKYGHNYDDILVKKNRISALKGNTGLDQAWNLLAAHKAFNGFSLTYQNRYYQRNRLLGAGEFFKVVDKNGNVVKDAAGNIKFDVMGLKLGEQKYSTHYHPEKGNNYLHFSYRHWDTGIGDFKRIGLKNKKEINELIFTVIKSQTGVNIDYSTHPNTIVYKFYSEKTGQYEYLAIGLHSNDKSIHTCFIVDQITTSRFYQTISSTTKLNDYTFSLNKRGNIL